MDLPPDFGSPFDSPGQRLTELFERVDVARPVVRSLFTFGDTDMPYWLVVAPDEVGGLVELVRGSVHVTRPTILRPDSSPEFFGFFEQMADEMGADLSDLVQFVLQRTAAFEQLKVANRREESTKVTDSVDEAVDRLNRRLDDEEDEDTAIVTAPHGLGVIAVLRYATERISRSAPDNVQELRERGFLPGL